MQHCTTAQELLGRPESRDHNATASCEVSNTISRICFGRPFSRDGCVRVATSLLWKIACDLSNHKLHNAAFRLRHSLPTQQACTIAGRKPLQPRSQLLGLHALTNSKPTEARAVRSRKLLLQPLSLRTWIQHATCRTNQAVASRLPRVQGL